MVVVPSSTSVGLPEGEGRPRHFTRTRGASRTGEASRTTREYRGVLIYLGISLRPTPIMKEYVCVSCIKKKHRACNRPGRPFCDKACNKTGGLAPNPPCDKPIEDCSTLHRGPRQGFVSEGPRQRLATEGGDIYTIKLP